MRGCAPLMVALLGPLMGERLGAGQWLAVGLICGGGAMSAGSYGIALWAMTQAPVALVAALRETSILFATAIAALVLRERISRTRLLAVGLIAGGACAMRLA
jgi:drug/metabolite transporter (DMT)-like permease